MTIAWRIVFAVLTLLTTLALLALIVWSVFMAFWGITVVGTMLVAMFGFFVYHDYQFFFGKKDPAATDVQQK